MGAYVLFTVYLFQRGSSESKDPDKAEPVDEDPQQVQDRSDVPWPVRYGGQVLRLYEHSLATAFVLLFLVSFVLHAVGGAREYSQEQLAHGGQAVSTAEFLRTSEFWFQSFQTGRASSWPSSRSWCCQSSCASAGPRIQAGGGTPLGDWHWLSSVNAHDQPLSVVYILSLLKNSRSLLPRSWQTFSDAHFEPRLGYAPSVGPDAGTFRRPAMPFSDG